MNCKQVQRQLVSYINGELEEKEEEEFVKHIRHCPECYEELEVYSTVFAGIRQLDGAEEEIDYRTLVEDYLETILAGKRKKTPEQLRQMDRGQLEQYVADLAAKKK